MLHQTQEIRTSSRLGMGSDFFFLSESVIADFNLTDRALSDCRRTLVTRRSELGKLKASDVDNFTIYALKDEIIDGEEEISDELADKKKQDIHAKIYRNPMQPSSYLSSNELLLLME